MSPVAYLRPGQPCCGSAAVRSRDNPDPEVRLEALAGSARYGDALAYEQLPRLADEAGEHSHAWSLTYDVERHLRIADPRLVWSRCRTTRGQRMPCGRHPHIGKVVSSSYVPEAMYAARMSFGCRSGSCGRGRSASWCAGRRGGRRSARRAG